MKIVHRCLLSLYDRANIESDAIIACQKTFFEADKATLTTSLIIALLSSMRAMCNLGP
jgi:hypothetical protein